MNKYVAPLFGLVFAASAHAQLPAVTGHPVFDTPKLLYWPRDFGPGNPDLTDPAGDELNDLHGTAGHCDLVLSTEGNYHMALHDLWMKYLKDYPNDGATRLYTTSPPVAPAQIMKGGVRFGNFTVDCRPQLSVGSMKVMNKLKAEGALDGQPVPLYTNNGDVILVKRGNPKHIHSVWDLGRPDVHVVTPNPRLEPGAFNNYATTIYQIAEHTKGPQGWTADRLFNSIFNSHEKGKWIAGLRIHHRDVPQAIAYGHADAGVLLYHLALFTKQSFPGKFDIIPLGGTVNDPRPEAGNVTTVTYIAKVKGHWTPRQEADRDHLYKELMSPAFTKILEEHGLKRP